MISKNSYWIFRALPGRRRGGGGLGDTFTTTNAASFGLGGVFGGGKPRSAGIKIGGGTDPMLGKWFWNTIKMCMQKELTKYTVWRKKVSTILSYSFHLVSSLSFQ